MPLIQTLKNIDDYCYRFSRSKSILFEVMNGFGYECQAPIIGALLDDPNVNISITTSALGDEELTQTYIMSSPYAHHFIPPKRAIWKKWDLVVCTDAQGVWYQRNHKTAYLQHGITGRGNYPYDGKHTIPDNKKYFDYFLASSPNIAHDCIKRMPQLTNKTDTRIVGFPAMDPAFNKTNTTSTSTASLSFNADKPTLLFCSHWDEYSLLKTIGHDVVSLLSQQHQYNVLLTAHPYNWDSEEILFTDHKDWKKFFQGFTKLDDVHFIAEPNIIQWMPLIDLLISDHSSSSIECCAFNKPVFRYHNPRYPFNDTELSRLANKATQPFHSVKDLQLLLQEEILVSTHQAERKQLTQYCYVNPGTAAKVAAKEILTICGETRQNPTLGEPE